MRLGVPERGGGVRERARRVNAFRRLLNAHHRRVDAVRAIGVGEVRHQRNLPHVGNRFKLLPDAVHPLRHKTETVHATVDFKIDIQRRVQLRLRQRL